MPVEDPDGLRLFDKVSGQQLDVLQALLFTRFEFTHLPELYEIVGRDAFLKFIDILGGQKIEIPSRDVFEQAIRDVTIYLRVRSAAVSARPRMVRELASRYNLDITVVRAVYARVAGDLRNIRHPDAPPDGEDFDV